MMKRLKVLNMCDTCRFHPAECSKNKSVVYGLDLVPTSEMLHLLKMTDAVVACDTYEKVMEGEGQ
jgi:hypothetical protein